MEDFCESCTFETVEAPEQDVSKTNSKPILYSTGCPKCKVVEMKLKQAGIEFEVISDVDQVVAFGKAHDIMSAPILDIDGKVLDFSKAVAFLKEIR